MSDTNKVRKSFYTSKQEAEKVSVYLKTNKIQYEASGYGPGTYFSLMVTEAEAEAMNKWLGENEKDASVGIQ